MTSASSFEDHSLDRFHERLAAIEPRVRALISGLSPERLATRPPGGGWSIDEVFEHLCLTHTLYLDRTLPSVIAKARSRKPPSRPYVPSLLGGLLLSALREDNGLRFPTIRSLNVDRKVRGGVIEAFLASLTQIESQMREADGHDLGVSFHSPVMPIMPLRLGDAFAVLIEHSHRHLAQAERVRAATGG